MDKYTPIRFAATALSAAWLLTGPAADARNQTAIDGSVYSNPTATNACVATAGGQVQNTCGAGSFDWTIPLHIDTAANKAPIVNATAYFGSGTVTCNGRVLNADGTIAATTAAKTWSFGGILSGDQTLASLAVGATQSYRVGCTLGYGTNLNSVRYTP
jgi:hypothetical protein